MSEAIPLNRFGSKTLPGDDGHSERHVFSAVSSVPAHAEASDYETAQSSAQRAIDWLRHHQSKEGFWAGNVDTNSCIEAEWLLAAHILGIRLPNEQGIIQALLNRQRPDGSWDVYFNAPRGDINSTVEVYAALRARGMAVESAPLKRAREWILANGGPKNVRVFTRYWLAMIGVWSWHATPNIPPEIIYLPEWFPINIYNFAQWARATIVPLAVITARRPVWPLPGGTQLDELFPSGREAVVSSDSFDDVPLFSLEALFVKLDRLLHMAQDFEVFRTRGHAIRLCLEWMLRHQDADGAWGGIQPPWIYGLIALTNEGYPLSHPAVAKGLSAISTDQWSFQRDGGIHLQATESSVWDTMLSILALEECGCTADNNTEMQNAILWLLNQQVLVPGDWAIHVKEVEPGGWAFERANLCYPDLDDTAVALLALGKVRRTAGYLTSRVDEAIRRGVAWMLALQSRNGGWGAFDKDNDKKIISKLPFCNFGEALDPPSVDVTGHVVEALGVLGFTLRDDVIKRAVGFIQAEQESDGSWFGRWGVNHIYGTAAVLPALRSVGEDMSKRYIRRAAAWVISKQNSDGGWGESCASYMDPALIGVGPSTPSQTAWGLMALLAVSDHDSIPAIRRGIRYLCRTQMRSGTWTEDEYTAAGFPGYGVGARINLRSKNLNRKLHQGTELSRGFMINFNMYRHYFPLIALGRFLSMKSHEQS